MCTCDLQKNVQNVSKWDFNQFRTISDRSFSERFAVMGLDSEQLQWVMWLVDLFLTLLPFLMVSFLNGSVAVQHCVSKNIPDIFTYNSRKLVGFS